MEKIMTKDTTKVCKDCLKQYTTKRMQEAQTFDLCLPCFYFTMKENASHKVISSEEIRMRLISLMHFDKIKRFNILVETEFERVLISPDKKICIKLPFSEFGETFVDISFLFRAGYLCKPDHENECWDITIPNTI
jgi:hypothetical protein